MSEKPDYLNILFPNIKRRGREVGKFYITIKFTPNWVSVIREHEAIPFSPIARTAST